MLKRLAILTAFLFAAAPAFAACNTSLAPIYSATNLLDLQDCFTNYATHSGDKVHVSGAGFPITTRMDWIAPPNATIYGDGDNSLGGGDVTVLSDNDPSNNPNLVITTNASGTFRMYGLTFQGGTGAIKYNCMVGIYGFTKHMRIHHVHLKTDNYTVLTEPCIVRVGGYINGVFDHILADGYGATNIIKTGQYDRDAYGEGDASWAADTGLGTLDFTFVEDSTFNNHINGTRANNVMNDIDHGGKMVLRYNTAPQGSWQTHPTGGSQTSRGARAWEVYQNNFDDILAHAGTANYNTAFISNGTGVMWGNSAQVAASENFITLHSMRRNNPTASGYQQGEQTTGTDSGLGYCGPKYQTGRVSTVGTAVTWVSGGLFSTSWPVGNAGSMIIISGQPYRMTAVPSSTAMTITTNTHDDSSAGVQTNVPYTIGSTLDSNTNVNTGGPCADQPGRGKGLLLTGSYQSATKINSITGVGPTDLLFGVAEASEPMYFWNNIYSCASCAHEVPFGVAESDVILPNVDYVLDTGASCVSGGACTSGVGIGTVLPTSCTDPAGFWKTNGGTWNDGSNPRYTGQGQLYKCVSGIMTLYYEPAPYPHPEVRADNAGGCTPDHLAFTAQPSNAVQGASIGTVTVVVKDSGGITCGSDTSTITLTKKSGTCTGMTLNGTASGTDPFTTTNLNLTGATGSCALTAADGSLTPADSNAFTISSGVTPGGSRGFRRAF